MGMTSIWERHKESPILHEPGESPSLGFPEQLSAQGMTTLSVVTTGPLWAEMNVSRVWISLCYSQEIPWVVFPYEARAELTGSCALKCTQLMEAAASCVGSTGGSAWSGTRPFTQPDLPFSANWVLNYSIAFLCIP